MSARATIGVGFLVLGVAFLAPSLGLLAFEPQMGFREPADYLRIDLARRGYEAAIWRVSDVAELVYAVSLLGIAGGLGAWSNASETVVGRMAAAAAIAASALFLVVGMIGIAGVAAANGIGSIDGALDDSSMASALVLRSAFRAASVFAMGVFLSLFGAASFSRRMTHPVVTLLAFVPAIASLAFPWMMLPVPLAYVAWFAIAGVNLLAGRARTPAS